MAEFRNYDHDYDYAVKFLLLGDSGVGKTSLVLRYSQNYYTPSYISTIGLDFNVKYLEIGDQRVKVMIWDTAGQERFRSIAQSYYRGTHGVVVVYDVTREATFHSVTRWLSDLTERTDSRPQIAIVGNKCDLTNQREVTTQEGETLAQQFNANFYETSAKEASFYEVINRIFAELSTQILAKTPKTSNVSVNIQTRTNSLHKTDSCC